MRGTSAESLSAVRERLEPLLSTPEAGTLGEELFSVTRMLDSSAALRRALTDPNAVDEVKVGLVRRLLQDKVSDITLDVVSGLARSRWSAARDLGDACEQLAVLASVAAADTEPGRLDQLEMDLFRFGRIVEADPELRAAISDRSAPAQRKATLVARILHGKVGPQAMVLARQAAAYPRGRRFERIIDEMTQVAAARRHQSVAKVISVIPLTTEQQERLGAALARIYGRDLRLNLDIDPEIIGGVRVTIGDETIDGSILSRLADTERRLTSR